MLLWRNREATEMVIRELAPTVAPMIWLASQLWDENKCGQSHCRADHGEGEGDLGRASRD